MMFLNHILRIFLAFLAIVNSLPVITVTASLAIPMYTYVADTDGLTGNGPRSGAHQTAVVYPSTTTSSVAIPATVTTGFFRGASTIVTTTFSSPLRISSTLAPTSRSYTTADPLRSSFYVAKKVKMNHTSEALVGLVIALIVGGLFVLVLVLYFVHRAREFHNDAKTPGVLPGFRVPTGQNIDLDVIRNYRSTDTLPRYETTDTLPRYEINDTQADPQADLEANVTKSKKRQGMVIETTDCHWLAKHDSSTPNISIVTKGPIISPPILSPMSPMSPLPLFDALKKQAEDAMLERKQHQEDAYEKLGGEGPVPA